MFARHSNRVVNFKYAETQGLREDYLWHRRGYAFEGEMEGDHPMVSEEQFDFLVKSIATCRVRETDHKTFCDTYALLGGQSYMTVMDYKSNTACLLGISSIGGRDEEFSFPILCGQVFNFSDTQ